MLSFSFGVFFQYADPVADLLDKWDVFHSGFRLFRESCVFHKGNYVKDLSKLGRDLPQVIIVDNSPASYIFHPENAVRHTLFLDRGSIDLSGAREKEGHFHYKNFLRASKWGITCHTCSIFPKSLYWGLGLSLIHSKGILGWWSRYGMWYLFSKHLKSCYNESDLLFLVHH